jgi:hypothetical protein
MVASFERCIKSKLLSRWGEQLATQALIGKISGRGYPSRVEGVILAVEAVLLTTEQWGISSMCKLCNYGRRLCWSYPGSLSQGGVKALSSGR